MKNSWTAYLNDPAGMSLVIKQYILDGVDPLPSLDGITVSGGRLNIYKAASQMLNPDIIFDPMSILKVMWPDKQDSVALAFTNNTNTSINYTLTYPDTLEWLSLSGQTSGSLNPFSTGNIKVHFDTDGLPADTLFTYLTFRFGDDEQFMVPVHLFVDPFVSVGPERGSGEAGKQGSLEMWPNPCREMLNVECLMLNAGKKYSLAIYNSSGKQVQEITIPAGQDVFRINTGSYAAGVYTAIIKSEDQIIGSNKFIVLN